MRDHYQIKPIKASENGGMEFEVLRLWSSEDWVGCYKAHTIQEATQWIKERENDKEITKRLYMEADRIFGD